MANTLKRYNLQIWENPKATSNLLLFAQSIEQQLFDHTFDSFRAPALNTHTSAYEIFHSIRAYYDSKVKQGALFHSIDEFKIKLKNDTSISNKIFYQKIVEEIQAQIKIKDKIMELAILLISTLDGIYYNSLCKTIKNLILFDDIQSNIPSLASSFISELEFMNFDKRYIYMKSIKFFFSHRVQPSKITTREQIDEYFKLFETEKKDWTVLLAGPKVFLDHATDANELKIKILSSLPDDLKLKKAEDFIEEFPDKAIIQVNGKAKDPHSASVFAREAAEFFSDVCRFHRHGEDFKIEDTAFVRQLPTGYILSIKKHINPLLCGIEQRTQEKNQQIKDTLSIFKGEKFTERRYDYILFMKALDFHHAAMQSSSPENQLINLWSALEGFLPTTIDDCDRISHYSNYIIPCLILNYCHTFTSALFRELALSPFGINKFIENLFNKCNLYNFVQLISCEEYANERADLKNKLSDYPLLQYLIEKAFFSFNSPKNTRSFLERHRTNVRLHLSRIYTARNSIVHNASYDSSISLRTLLINLHNYFDMIIYSVSRLGPQFLSYNTVSSALEYMIINEKIYLSSLGNSENSFTSDNFINIFGTSNPLNPYYKEQN